MSEQPDRLAEIRMRMEALHPRELWHAKWPTLAADLYDLIAEVERLRAEVEELRDELRDQISRLEWQEDR